MIRKEKLTYGEKLVGMDMKNNDPTVKKIRSLYAQIIDLVNDMPCSIRSERQKLINNTIVTAITSQMWAVKAATWEE